jgi:hypothetical protein
MEKIYKLLRINVGIAAVLLPVLSILFGLLGKTNEPTWYYSISATFYANSAPIMIGTLFFAAAFLICYGVVNPYKTVLDQIFSIVSGISFIVIACFPCADTSLQNVGLLFLPVGISSIIHTIFAVLCFVSLGILVAFCFTKTNITDVKTKQKKIRNKIYYICGALIGVVMLITVLGNVFKFNNGPAILIYETLLLWLTGIAWFTKSGLICRD